jgi:hypothetical protein
VKVATVASTLQRYADALEVAGASKASSYIHAFVSALEPLAAANMETFVSLFSGSAYSKPGEPPLLKDLIPTLEALLQLLTGIAGPDMITGLNALLAVAREEGDISIVGIASNVRKHVASASKKQTKRGATQMDQSVVDGYLKKLDAALGDDVPFKALFSQIEDDKRVTKVEAVELATRFVGPTPQSMSRPKALQRVLNRHLKLVDFKRASASIRGGRSAA